ncbi:polymorphic toxin type 17 domain-containing protein [Sinomicrobium kalidii]|uniref:polymorphic toxin type 17 domain-containing protein n=1 Tax=Sinomicrobium kalidii TaxID=2900738 RepID=UPI001E32E826|nr:polymorphic toxin type 17 domain-containing protein [Sinomicrobium kalidii]UGU17916.1 polymorphic toxin type 17 domain-containing protein [Sinomicrobium kalidii]
MEQGPGGNYHVDDQGKVIIGPYLGGLGAVGLIGGPGKPINLSIPKIATSSRSLVKVAQLPLKGKIRFIPRAVDVKSGKIFRKNGGFLDKFGNIWKKGPSRTKGQAFEWDVQLSAKGKAQLGHLSKDGKQW